MPMVPIVETRVPRYDAYTYEEVNARPFLPITRAQALAPTPPMQPDIAPISPARMPVAFFYHHAITNLGRGSYSLGPDLTGAHTQIAPGPHDGSARGSWTWTPRGIMRAFGTKQGTVRNDPSSFGDESPEIGGR